jgi:hypothetical protein
MKATIEINEDVIKQAILQYFKKMDASEVTLKSTALRDYTDRYSLGNAISGTVTVEIDAIAQ